MGQARQMKLDDALQGVSRLAFDTAPIIYFVEANPTYDKLVTNIFNRVAAGELERLDLGHQPERSFGAADCLGKKRSSEAVSGASSQQY